MVDDIFDTSRPRGRVEIRTGVGPRRRWSEDEKGRIVAESYAAGAVASEVARRHEISPQHLFAWRKAARAGLLTLPADAALEFVPVVADEPDVGTLPGVASGSASVAIEIGGAIVRATPGVDLAWLRD